MIKRDLLLEIGTEEVPARFMTWVCRELTQLAEKSLTNLRIGHGEVRTTGTPRRIVLTVHDIEDRQADFEETVKGPPKTQALDANGEYTKAALGFAKSRGVDVSALSFETIKGVEYLHASIKEEGKQTKELLPDLLCGLLKDLVFPKNMYWADPSVRSARPIRWLVALHGSEIVHFEYGGIASGSSSRGHRFMGHSVDIPSASDHDAVMKKEYVVTDHEERKKMIADGMAKIAGELGCVADDDPDLLEENAFLVEYPVPFAGSFDEKYLEIPEEVLIATMKKNQRYFPLRDKNGRLAAHFIGVSNNQARDMSVVRSGNERVLRARLEDAEFFWKEDKQKKLESRLPELEKILYQEKLGSLADKCARVRKIAALLARDHGGDLAHSIDRAAVLSKADLVTGMVFEFPEVQGVMGREYARIEGEDEEVALALYEQYLPRFSGDEIPTRITGAILGIADRADSIMGIHKAGLPPTGSQDPYALRRAARSINEIIWGLGLDIDLSAVFAEAARLLGASDEVVADVDAFFKQRLTIQLRERGYQHGTTSLAVSRMGHRPLQALKMLEAFDGATGESWYEPLILSAVRVKNILGKLSHDEISNCAVRDDLLKIDAERELRASLAKCAQDVRAALGADDWKSVCRVLSELSPAVSRFFDGVMVMDEDKDIRANRIALLAEAKALFDSIGDLSLLKQ